jgi:hypothetical protein
MVVRAQTGLLKDFDDLLAVLDRNVQELSRPRSGSISMFGIDPIKAFGATMLALHNLALNMRRTSNVGIGYANAAEHLKDGLRQGSV